jgi:rare lipoprotein A
MASLNLRGTLTLLFFLGQLFSTVFTVPLQAEELPPDSNARTSVTTKVKEQEGVEGIASYYAKRYNGRRTNSGQRYDPDKLTAAHPSLPHGTKVRVINLANDSEVVVTVNDRCRKRKEPFIDLSRAAAKHLGFLGKGTAKVRIIPLKEEPS